MINATEHNSPIVSLMIIGEKFYTPPNLFALAQDRARNKHARTVLAVLVTKNTFITILLKTLFKISPNLRNFYGQATTLEEGRTLACERIAKSNTSNV
jgi:hypothetical protein